jgi:drug/metabolite transporter (DMT)-like permease
MVGAAGMLTLTDAIAKHLLASYPIGQIVCVRQAAAVVPILLYVAWRSGLGALRVTRWPGQIGRGLLLLAGTLLLLHALAVLPLTTVSALVFASPLFVAALSRPLLGERVSLALWLSVAAGFCGVLVMLRPGTGFEWALVLPLGAALAYALRDLLTRALSRTESSMSILFWSTVIVGAGAPLVMPFAWAPLGWASFGWMVLSGLLTAGAQFLMIEAFRLGRAALVAPFKYSGMLWALLLGFVLWHEIPDGWLLAGAAIVVASGIHLSVHGTRRA